MVTDEEPLVNGKICHAPPRKTVFKFLDDSLLLDAETQSGCDMTNHFQEVLYLLWEHLVYTDNGFNRELLSFQFLFGGSCQYG